ncbi:DUF72 domain-containing protein [Amphiplicatus metriothermophilus]|uniref:Uncharacterized conserved protein YecE, DUF72 family n=1 Tax=Amphiplicatus metriothermophilus TaxID=1519374 RepID=A0A239PKT4_9PROT|nr:DUF72 domain-containing protein [Amphiplicatus metriothermophilus]MBB5517723.1 uncharacterized protein YecE (DUF72 family) [Amphiplicatus metriothermophilus]SNT67943.1 Uncharacterized conserved protein YecE, DUF72 family [Amphiplicatus metriothermophilus]
MTGRIFVGVGGWSYAPWRGTFYPKGLAQRRELDHASRRLGSIEINATYYSSFKPATFAKWRAETPDGFVFAVKASRYCVNRRNLGEAADSIAKFFAQGLEQLGDRLGPINWQFRETQKFDAAEIEAFLRLLPRETGGLPLRHALEVRHPSFKDPAFYDLARRRGVAVVFADHADFPCIDEATADFAYARLMRTREDAETGYAPSALAGWAERARKWAARGDVFIYFIAGAKARNPAAAQALIERL